jgi:uncharacterized protein (DUF486 family)
MDNTIASAILIGSGCVMGAIGSYTWIQLETKTLLEQFLISLLVLTAGFNFFFGLKGFFVDDTVSTTTVSSTEKLKWYSKEGLWGLFLVYIGAVFYALAAYYHLAIPNWSFLTAFLVALPLILIEYHFSLRGNHIMYDRIQWNATQVAVVSLVFYFINTWIMNKFIFKRKFVLWREIVGFLLLAGAFAVIQWDA